MRKQNSIIRILIIVFAVLIALLVIGGGIYLFSESRKLKAIAIVPEFPETSLEVGTQYAFTVKTTPDSASIKKANCVVDDPTCSFVLNSEGQAILTTGMSEGQVTVYVECKDIKSQVMTFSIVDSVARAQAEAAAQAEEQRKAEEAAAAAAEAEAAAQVKKYVKSTGDDVNVRSTNSTDGDVLGKAKKGDMFEKVEDVDDWTHIIYKGQDGYMKTEFLAEISEEEFQEGPKEEDKKEEEKKDEKKDEKKTEEDAEKKAAEEAAKAAADAEKAAQEAAAAQAALQAAAAASANIDLNGLKVTQKEYDALAAFYKGMPGYENGTPAEIDYIIKEHDATTLEAVLKLNLHLR